MLTRINNWLDEKDYEDPLVTVGSFVVGVLIGGTIVGLIILHHLIPINLYSILALVIGTIVLMEILYGFNKKEKKITTKKVIWLKVDSLLTSLIIIINCLNIVWLVRNIKINLKVLIQVLIQWIGYIGISLLALVIVGAIIYFIIIPLIRLWLRWNKKRLNK